VGDDPYWRERRHEIGDGVQVQHNQDGTLDEIVAKATSFHIEQMSDSAWWIGVTVPGSDNLLHVNLWTPRARIRASYARDDGSAEAGEFDSGVVAPPWFDRG
jgi:hypothetical protein